MLTILLLEDHTPTARWMHDVAQQAFPETDILHANCISAAKKFLQETLFHLALLDIHLPDGNGTDLIPALKKHNPNAMAVMTTVFDDDQHLFDALRAGAQGYLLKEQPQAELVQRLRGILKGEPPLSPGIARRMLAYFQPAPAQKNPPLSPREQETLTLLAKGYSVKELARMLLISDHTAAGYVKTIYRKLNVSSRAEATLEATRLGLVHSR
jgi:DNA-binding NarL/FixJ family response regulator